MINKDRGFINVQAQSVILAMEFCERPRGALNIAGTRPAGVYAAEMPERFVNIEG